VDLSVTSASVTALLGPNAAGKTTLLGVLSTLRRPERGLVRVAGLDVVATPALVRAKVGLVAHQPLMFPDLTAEENLRLYARLYGLAAPGARIEAVLRAAGLWPRRAVRVRVLSRGQQQRLAIARAVLHEPEVLLLDEPHTGLDPAAADDLDATVRALADEGRTVLLTTHDLARAHALADRLVILARGRVAWSSARDDVQPPELAERFRALTGSGTAVAGATPEPVGVHVGAAPVAGHTGKTSQPAVGVLGAAAAVLWKDVLIEVRAREVVPPVVVFGLVVLVLIHFTLAVEPRLEPVVAPGALWVALIFGSTLGLSRLMGGDIDSGCLTGLLLSPADRSGLFVGKFAAGYLFSLVVAAVLLPAFVVLLNLSPAVVVPLAGVVGLGLVGWQAAGTLAGALAVSTRAREVLLPVLLFPITLPLVIAAVKASAGVVAGQPMAELAAPLALMASYGVIFLVLGFLLYPLVMENGT
jgi:heme exporter protein A